MNAFAGITSATRIRPVANWGHALLLLIAMAEPSRDSVDEMERTRDKPNGERC